jgi:hypothetical protein
MLVVAVVELLLIARAPEIAPVVLGEKEIERVRVWPGFRVCGRVAGPSARPVPDTEAELTISGAVPEEVSVTELDFEFPLTTFPKFRLLTLRLISGVFAVAGTISQTARL